MYQQGFPKKDSCSRGSNSKKKELGLNEIKKPLHYKANNELSEDKNYSMGQYLTKISIYNIKRATNPNQNNAITK